MVRTEKNRAPFWYLLLLFADALMKRARMILLPCMSRVVCLMHVSGTIGEILISDKRRYRYDVL
eukprot:SAG22_NODE_1375_length_4557_cov_4.997208_2_plen_64_part_00